MNPGRRTFLRGVIAAAGVASTTGVHGQQTQPGQPGQHQHPPAPPTPAVPAPERRADPRAPRASPPALDAATAVETPDVPTMPWQMEDGVKVFHIVAEPVRTEFVPGRAVDVWGFNGSMPGPTVEVTQGDRVRFIVHNQLPELFSMHWHGLEVPIGMDGVPGVTQDPIKPGETFTYEFTVHQHGTFFYHSHMAMQEMMGMIGLFIIHPRQPYQPLVQRDFGLIFQEWALLPNNTVPHSLSMEFNWLTINGKAGPATTPLLVKLGERVRIRMVNLGMDHHPIHLHGNTFYTVGTEAGRIPESAWEPGNTVLLGVAHARDVEFEATYAGDWMLHCHLPHHMMNQMVSMVGPMAHVGSGLHTNMSMPRGMGIVAGRALDEGNAPALGRTIAAAGGFERPVPNAPLGAAVAEQAQQEMPHAHGAADAWKVPGFPQDMFMPMDEAVAKPETYGLRPTWSGGVMGMMTLVRVLEPELFDKIQALKTEQAAQEARG